MKKVILLVLFISALLFVGCKENKEPEKVDDLSIETTSTNERSKEELNQIDDATNNTKTYSDESHKEIEYDKLSFELNLYHIVSYERNDETINYVCEIDKDEVRPQTHFELVIHSIENQDVNDINDILLYVNERFQSYNSLSVYKDIIDDSGITNLYIIKEQDMTNYIVCYSDTWILIESDYDKLKNMLLKNRQIADYSIDNLQIECAQNYQAKLRKTTISDENKIEYNIIQGLGGNQYTGYVSIDNEGQFVFSLNDVVGNNLLNLSTYASDANEVVDFLDVNMDGYVDVRFLEGAGTFNNNYVVYTWQSDTKSFEKVEYNEMLSYFEVYDGYILNWLKEDADSGVLQKLVWEDNNLIKESEEEYKADE